MKNAMVIHYKDYVKIIHIKHNQRQEQLLSMIEQHLSLCITRLALIQIKVQIRKE